MWGLCLVSPHGISTAGWASPLGNLFVFLHAGSLTSLMIRWSLCAVGFPGDVWDLGDLHHFISLNFPTLLWYFLFLFFTQRRGKDLRTLRDTHPLQTVQCTLRWTWACPGIWHVFWSDRAELSFTYKTSHSHERMLQLTDYPWGWLFCEP